MDTCFVIQPFDSDKFDKRFEDIFKPAITKASLEPYRIDKDLSVRIPIDEIEKGIIDSALCFAEITTDNPNVWYELGYAFACSKDVVLVCSEERTGKFPFDIQHRHIITYKTGSKSDYETLEDTITRKIKALQQKAKTVKTLSVTPVLSTEGLKSHEIALLIILIENQLTSEERMAIYNLRSEMNKAGYTDVATSVGIRSLSKLELVTTFMAHDQYHDSEYTVIKLSPKGEEWIMNNQDLFQFRKDYQEPPHPSSDDLPF